jgi:hypothetical protein
MEPTVALAALKDSLANAGYEIGKARIAGREAVVASRSDFRWRWFATQLVTFVIVFTTPDLNEAEAEELTAAGQRYAIEHKGGLPRGCQTGTATVAVFLAGKASDPGVRAWFSRKPKQRRFAAMRFPALIELDSATLTYFTGRLRLGFSYSEHLHAVVEELIAPASRAAEPFYGSRSQ